MEDSELTDEWLQAVDWSKTRAYAVGLVGVFINLQGREEQGIVQPGAEYESLKSELIGKLGGHLLIGYNHGYRISWDGASGVVNTPAFEDNEKAWSGDHIVDPRIVPGIILANRPINNPDPHIIDLAPTALKLFGVSPPPYMEGAPVFDDAIFGIDG